MGFSWVVNESGFCGMITRDLAVNFSSWVFAI
jgi:hypothetical protein